MDVIIERVNEQDTQKVKAIYQILRDCGEDMYLKYGLTHWQRPYPIEKIRNDCKEKEVYIAQCKRSKRYCATFTLKKMSDVNGEKSIEISKVACHPSLQGKGLGLICLDFAEDRCKELNYYKIRLDVYSESLNAIKFYKNRNFRIVANGHTTNFEVFYMEKRINN